MTVFRHCGKPDCGCRGTQFFHFRCAHRQESAGGDNAPAGTADIVPMLEAAIRAVWTSKASAAAKLRAIKRVVNAVFGLQDDLAGDVPDVPDDQGGDNTAVTESPQPGGAVQESVGAPVTGWAARLYRNYYAAPATAAQRPTRRVHEAAGGKRQTKFDAAGTARKLAGRHTVPAKKAAAAQ
jgi:hypothetical protein